MEAAKFRFEEMAEIYLERNMQLQIPGWDFQGPVWISAAWSRPELRR